MADHTMTITKDSPVADSATVYGYRRSPAHHLTEEMALGSCDAATLREIPFQTKVVLRVAPGGAGAAALEGALGVPLPTRAGQVSAATDGSDLSVLWFGPDDFLVVAPDEAESGVPAAQLTARLADALGTEPGQVADVSANRTTLELAGPMARQVLDKSCQLDLHPRVFPVGHTVLTQLESTGVFIWRTGEDTWRIMPRASFATHVVRWLLDGMREYR